MQDCRDPTWNANGEASQFSWTNDISRELQKKQDSYLQNLQRKMFQQTVVIPSDLESYLQYSEFGKNSVHLLVCLDGALQFRLRFVDSAQRLKRLDLGNARSKMTIATRDVPFSRIAFFVGSLTIQGVPIPAGKN